MISLLLSFLVDYLWIILTILTTAVASYLFYPALLAGRSASRARHETPEILQSTTTTDRPVLSIVVPAYNEELRLTIMLQEAYEYLSAAADCRALTLLQKEATAKNPSGATTVEWILVNDGSTDQTCQVYRDWVQKLPSNSAARHSFVLVSQQPNAGKGAAVQTGMLTATGNFVLMVDADGATEFGSALESMAESASSPTQFWLGSRAHLQQADGVVQRSAVRRALQYAFHAFVVQLIGAGDIRDTQCGFKLFRYDVAVLLFSNLHLQRWAFDTEVVYLAAATDQTMQEVPVTWQEVDGSKLHTGGPLGLALVAVSMLRDMICVRLCYSLGIWRIQRLDTAATTTTGVRSKSKSS